MEPRYQSEESPSLSTLVTGIVADVQKLIRQELALAKTEIKQDWVRGKNAAALFVGASLFCALGLGFGLLAFAQALVALGFPIGGAYSIIAIILFSVAFASYLLAKRWVKAMTVIPDVSEKLDKIASLKERIVSGNPIELVRPVEN